MRASKLPTTWMRWLVRLAGVTSAVVRRFTGTKVGPGRSQVAFALTHETIARLAGDLAG